MKAEKAHQFAEITQNWVENDGLSDEFFGELAQINAGLNPDDTLVRAWLYERLLNPDEQLIVSWNADLAVVTRARVFTEYWDGFCYPVSDDVLIWPVLGNWALFYHHEEYFFWGLRNN